MQPCCPECGRPLPKAQRPRRRRGRPSPLHDRRAEVVGLLRAFPTRFVAAELGVSAATVNRYRGIFGIPAPKLDACHLHWKTTKSGQRRCHVRIPVAHWPFETGVRDGAAVVVTRATAMWNAAHPGDPVKKGEEIHHLDEDCSNDQLGNFAKLTKAEHGQLHGSLYQRAA